jgi:starvation-inducible DNA-binding protein
MYHTAIDISRDKRIELSELLNLHLASAIDLQMQMKQAHWNVKGPNFSCLHELFDNVAASVQSYADLIAERVVQLGGIAEGTLLVTVSRTKLSEYPLSAADGADHVICVTKALSNFGREVRSAIQIATALDDAVSADLFTEVVRGIDQWLWFVEAHSQTSASISRT